VAIRILERVRPVELAVDREPDRVLVRAGADVAQRFARGRVDAEAKDLAAVVRRRRRDVPPELPAVDHRRVDVELESRALDRRQVTEHREARGARRRRDRLADDRVVRLLVVIGEVEVHAAAEDARLEATLPFRRPLGPQVRVAQGVRNEARRVGAGGVPLRTDGDVRGRRVVGLQSDRATGLYTRRAVRGAQAEVVQPILVREEALIRDHPRQAGLRIQDVLEVGAEGAVLVGPRRDDEEHPIAVRRLLLRVETERLVDRLKRIPAALRGGLTDVLRARGQVGASAVDGVVLLVRVVRAERRLEVEVGARVPGVVVDDLRREVAEVVLRGADRSLTLRAGIGAFIEPADVVAVDVRQVETDRPVVLHPVERAPGRIARPDEALRASLVVDLENLGGTEAAVTVAILTE